MSDVLLSDQATNYESDSLGASRATSTDKPYGTHAAMNAAIGEVTIQEDEVDRRIQVIV